MDSFYGPVRFQLSPYSDTFRKATPIDVTGPATIGKHAIDPKGAIARLTNPQTYSEEARLNRFNSRKIWRYDDHTEKTEIFKVTKTNRDFRALTRDKRGINVGEWMTNLVMDEEIIDLRTKKEDMDVAILTTIESSLLGDSRVEVANTFQLSEDFLSKRFWVFPQGNIQGGEEQPPLEGFNLTVRTLEGGPASFEINSNSIKENLINLLDQIQKLIPKSDQAKEIWWTSQNPATSNIQKFALPGTNFSGQEFLPWVQTAGGGPDRTIWVGTAGEEYKYPVRPAVRVTACPNSHWWVTIVDSVTGEAYIHDSMRGSGSTGRAETLIENLNWIIETLPPAAKERLPVIRRSQKAPFQPISVPVQALNATQQRNGSDCGPFLLGNTMGFVDRLQRDDVNVEGICEENLIPDGWTAIDVRKKLLSRAIPVRLSSFQARNKPTDIFAADG